ncbi:sialoadhesin isoform X1 [Misgurnus anguillicaudatus]|uniref:sialoadhesin isoform X1 n=1 Tax=Misgurnus anguillicaudatus TaxID=75329 RepID=UPI003CCFAB6A
MKGQQVFHLLFQGVLLYETLAWEVRMPTEIHGLKGSCLVIPCSYSYTSNPPTNPHRVVWYQWVSKGFPLVYDPWYPDSVIDKFRGKTDLYNPTNSDRDCSLLIKSVDPSHNGEKIYTWIDPENIGWRTYEFYDVTSTIIVDSGPRQPTINIYGGATTGDSITVACFTFHTCPYSKPNITLKGIEGSDKVDDFHIENGLWKIALTRTGVVKDEQSEIECNVTHHGGITTRATKNTTEVFISQNGTDVMTFDMKTNMAYILSPIFVLLVICILAGVIIYKKCNRSSPNDTQELQTNQRMRSFAATLKISTIMKM